MQSRIAVHSTELQIVRGIKNNSKDTLFSLPMRVVCAKYLNTVNIFRHVTNQLRKQKSIVQYNVVCRGNIE